MGYVIFILRLLRYFRPPMRRAFLAMTAIFIIGASAPITFAEEVWTFLPSSPLMRPPLGDPREPHHALTAYLDKNRYEGEMGSSLELVRLEPGDGTGFAWGLFGSGHILLEQYGASFPMLGGDWNAGMYLAAALGDSTHRLSFQHLSSHLGDSLQDEVLSTPLEPLFFSREAFTLTSILSPLPDLRLIGEAGVWYNMYPQGDPWFVSLGLEAFTPFTDLLGRPLRGYLTVHGRWKGESGGTWNKTFHLGAQWKLEKEGSRALRLALVYQVGLSEYGQYYLTPDEHLGVSLFFDP